MIPENLLVEIRILKTSGNAHLNVAAAAHNGLLQGCCRIQIGAGNGAGGGEADGVLGVLISVAHMENIHLALQQLCQLEGIAPIDAQTVHGNQHFNGEILAEGLLHGVHDLDHQPGAVLCGAAVFIGAVVGVGGPELCHGAVVIGVVEGEHLKAKLL